MAATTARSLTAGTLTVTRWCVKTRRLLNAPRKRRSYPRISVNCPFLIIKMEKFKLKMKNGKENLVSFLPTEKQRNAK